MIGVGERIRRVRQERGLSVEEFARAIGISPKKVEEFERGISRPCDATLVYIARRFGVDYRWLALGEPQPVGV
ncbi:MAG: helix-turn-helix transcriptional regulator [Aquificae bacterium]|nr:helix-turn-helix transcriptional regulator [Aquificota bacterium]